VHSQNKLGGGGDNLGEELHGEIQERGSLKPRIGGGRERERKERAKKEERRRTRAEPV
jgi:hypothetical protein